MSTKKIKNLLIVESPAKSSTIKKYLGKDYEVMASFGHVSDLPKKNMGVDVENNFHVEYQISPDKKKVIADLKKASKNAEKVWIATDEDREGEAIGRHVANALGLDIKKTPRIVFHEITKDALQNAVQNPREIDINLVDAQQARRVLDRLVGFELSPILRKKIRTGLSAGRVQSVAVRLIVEKEREIQAFDSKSSYKTVGYFTHDNGNFPAVLNKSWTKKDDVLSFLEQSNGANYTIAKVEKKPGKKSPSAPFTTSTLQQEASRKLGMGVSRTMSTAQKLYEAGLITYMRTDSVNMSDTAIKACAGTIANIYGKEYIQNRKYKSKSSGAQEAHECIRPTNMNTPSAGADASQKRLYELIWKRTLASQMADAKVSKTQIDVQMNDSKYMFVAKGEVITFDGFLKVYMEGRDDENGDDNENTVLPDVKKGDKLECKEIVSTEKFARHPARYTEASLVKKLEEEGIGRPSTYAPTISTIQKRGYVIKDNKEGEKREYNIITLKSGKIKEDNKSLMYGADKNKLFPTDTGIVVNDFLVEHFPNVLDYGFTASVEKDFDTVAEGKKKRTEMLKDFYFPFHKLVEKTGVEAQRASGERTLGIDPKSGKQVIARLGRFGPMVQIGSPDDEEKPKYAGIRGNQSIESISLEQALELFKFPKEIGTYESENVSLGIGRFGPYVKWGSMFISIPKDQSIDEIEMNRAIELIEEKKIKDKEKYINQRDVEKGTIELLNGRYGPYIKYNKKNFKIPKNSDPKKIKKEEAMKIVGVKR